MHDSILGLSGHIEPSRHFGATDQDAYCLKVRVRYDNNWFSKMRQKKKSPISATIVDVKNRVYGATGVASMPRVQHHRDWRRAKNGVKTVEISFYLSRAEAERLGVGDGWYGHRVDLSERAASMGDSNVVRVDFVNKRRVS